MANQSGPDVTAKVQEHPPVTPDGRYFVVRGRLWRMSNPALAPAERDALVHDLIMARRSVGLALRSNDAVAEKHARTDVDRAKRALGERGPVWWDDGAPDYNRHMAANTLYAHWLEGLGLPAD